MKKRHIIIPLFIFFMCFSVMYITMKKYNIERVKDVYESIDDVKMNKIKDDNEKYNVLIYYPETKYQKLNDGVNEFVTRIYSEFKSSAINLNVDGLCLEVKYNISQNNVDGNDVISIIFDTKTVLEIMHPVEDHYTINYNVTTGKIVKIDDLILKNKDILKTFSDESYNKLSENEKINEFVTKEALREVLNTNKELYSNFAFEKQGIVIYFNTYVLAPSVAGNFSNLIEYSKLNNLF